MQGRRMDVQRVQRVEDMLGPSASYIADVRPLFSSFCSSFFGISVGFRPFAFEGSIFMYIYTFQLHSPAAQIRGSWPARRCPAKPMKVFFLRRRCSLAGPTIIVSIQKPSEALALFISGDSRLISFLFGAPILVLFIYSRSQNASIESLVGTRPLGSRLLLIAPFRISSRIVKLIRFTTSGIFEKSSTLADCHANSKGVPKGPCALTSAPLEMSQSHKGSA